MHVSTLAAQGEAGSEAAAVARVIFTAEQTLAHPPAVQCEPGVRPDLRRAWTPTEAQVERFAALMAAADSAMADLMGDTPVNWQYRRQYLGTYCGAAPRIQMLAQLAGHARGLDRLREHRRPAGYAGPLWHRLPFDYWGDVEPSFRSYDPVGDTLATYRPPHWEHLVPWPDGVARRADPGSICIALGFGPWSSWGADWLPLGWDERFPHLELRQLQEGRRGDRRLRLAPHSPRPPQPTVLEDVRDRRYALVFDDWSPLRGDSVRVIRWRAMSMGISVEGAWTGDTLRARAVTGSDNVGPGEPEADAFAVRYPCDDAQAAAAADAAMERLRTGARTAGEGR